MSGYTELGRTGLTVSRLGFGGYRVTDTVPEHREALSRALTAGINLIDTSTNYTDGGSERLIGSVLREAIESGRVVRDEVVVVSKVGYVQGRALEAARKRERNGEPFPEMVKLGHEAWHCIHPEFIRDGLRRSLDRLEIETLDVMLLHNPEYWLAQAVRDGAPLDEARSELDRRLQAAFACLEEEAAGGRISWYGASSNTVVAAPDSPETTFLTDMIEAAHAAGGDRHRFAVLQLPLNLLESGALFQRKEGADGDRTVLEAAAAEGVAVLANRPLNASAGGHLVRLAEPRRERSRKKLPALEVQLDRVGELEAAFRDRIAPEIQAPPDALQPADYFAWAERLRHALPRIGGLAEWSPVESQVAHTVGVIGDALGRNLSGDVAARWKAWRDRYLEALQTLLAVARDAAADRSARAARAITAALDPSLPGERRGEALARKALWTVASTPGVTCVLNGMRRPDYVEDAGAVLSWPPLEDPSPLYAAAARALAGS